MSNKVKQKEYRDGVLYEVEYTESKVEEVPNVNEAAAVMTGLLVDYVDEPEDLALNLANALDVEGLLGSQDKDKDK